MKKFLPHLLVILIALVSTVALTWPFTANLSTYYTDSGDYPLNAAILFYNQRAITEGFILNQKEYFQGFHPYPHPYSLASGNNAFIPALLFSPIYWLSQNFIFSVNAFALLTFVLSFLASFYSLNFLTKNKYAALIGALVYTFNPFILGRFPFHLDLLNRYFLPPLFLSACLFINKPSLRSVLLFGSFFTLNALSVNYYFLFSFTLLLTILIPYIFVRIFQGKLVCLFNFLRYGVVLVLFLPVIIYFCWPYQRFSDLEGAGRPLSANAFFSARLIDFVSPSVDNLIYADFVKSIDPYKGPRDDKGILNYEERALGLNIVPTVLFMLAFYAVVRRKQPSLSVLQTQSLWFYKVLLVLSFILMFGPFLGNTNLPFYYLYQVLHFLKGVRVPTRFEFIFYVPFSLFVSFGVLTIFSRFKKYSAVLALLIIIPIVMENLTVKDFSTRSAILPKVQSLNSHQELSFLAGKNTIHFPINIPDFGKESAYYNWAIVTKEKTTNTNNGYLPPDQVSFLTDVKTGFVDEDSLKRITALGLDYIIIHRDLLDQGDLEKYQKFKLNLNQAIVFDQAGVAIINVRDLKVDIKICHFDDDIETKLIQAAMSDNSQTGYVLLMTNKHDCYLPSLYLDRYKSIPVVVSGIKYTADIRMPVLILPKQQIVVSEFGNDLKLKPVGGVALND